MRSAALKSAARRFQAEGTTSEGLWAKITCPEVAQCLVCRGVIEVGEEVMCSPGRWVRHESCVWPGQARGIELAQASQVKRITHVNQKGLNFGVRS